MPTIDVTDAGQRLLANKKVTPGHCLEYVSRAIRNGLQPLIWNGLDTALNCWLLACGDKHDSRDVPNGFPAFLGAKRGSKAGDVMLSLGDGLFAATDYPGWGVVGVCTLEQREAQTGRKYLGYAGQFLGYTLTSTATASLDATPIGEDEMSAEHVKEILDRIDAQTSTTINMLMEHMDADRKAIIARLDEQTGTAINMLMEHMDGDRQAVLGAVTAKK